MTGIAPGPFAILDVLGGIAIPIAGRSSLLVTDDSRLTSTAARAVVAAGFDTAIITGTDDDHLVDTLDRHGGDPPTWLEWLLPTNIADDELSDAVEAAGLLRRRLKPS